MGLISGADAQVTPSQLQNARLNDQKFDPGSLLDYSKKTLQSEQKQPENTQPPAPEINITPPEDTSAGEDTGPAFLLNTVNVHGVTAFDDSIISGIFAPSVGKMIHFRDLMEMKEALNSLYLNNGYLTTRAFLPPQEISSGKIDIQVVEGRIDAFQIEGLKHLSSNYVLKNMAPLQGRVFRVQDLEAALRKVNQSPLVQVKATLKPGKETGTSEVVLVAIEKNPWDISVFTDNQGRKNVGFYQTGFTVNDNDVFGYGDHASISSLLSLSDWDTEGSQSIFGNYAIPLGSHGVEMGSSVSAGHNAVGGPLEALKINGRSYTVGTYLTGPVWRGKQSTLNWDAGLDTKRSLQFLDDVRFPELGIPNTEVRSMHTGLTWNRFDRLGQTTFQNEIEQGIRALGGKSAFFKYNADLTRVQTLLRGAYLIARLSAQLTPDNLVSTEQFQIGGAQSVRGYQEGALIGDQGYFSSTELRLPLSFFMSGWSKNFQLLGFFDAGSVGLTETSQADAHAGTTGNIRSLGVGLRAKVTKWLNGRIDAGFSFIDNKDEPTARIHFGLSSDLL